MCDTFVHRAVTLTALVQREGWRKGAELGLEGGETLAYLLGECRDLQMIGVDVWGHPTNEMDFYKPWDHSANERKTRQAVEHYKDRVTLHKMTTRDAAALVPDGSLDFVFIDADHRAPAVTEDIILWRPKIRPGGYLMGHDINWPSVREAVEHFYNKYSVEPTDAVWWVDLGA